jgi:hypothetical protein
MINLPDYVSTKDNGFLIYLKTKRKINVGTITLWLVLTHWFLRSLILLILQDF